MNSLKCHTCSMRRGGSRIFSKGGVVTQSTFTPRRRNCLAQNDNKKKKEKKERPFNIQLKGGVANPVTPYKSTTNVYTYKDFRVFLIAVSIIDLHSSDSALLVIAMTQNIIKS